MVLMHWSHFTANPVKRVVIRAEPEPYSRTGTAYRAYMEDGTPLYLAGETIEEARQRVRDSFAPFHEVVFVKAKARRR